MSRYFNKKGIENADISKIRAKVFTILDEFFIKMVKNKASIIEIRAVESLVEGDIKVASSLNILKKMAEKQEKGESNGGR